MVGAKCVCYTNVCCLLCEYRWTAVVVGFHCDVISCELAQQGMWCDAAEASGSGAVPHVAAVTWLPGLFTKLYILWSELSQRKLSPTSATAHYFCPENAIGLEAQHELSWYVKLG